MLGFCAISAAAADSGSQTNRVPPAAADGDLSVMVSARKWFEPLDNVPGSVTLLDRTELQQSGVQNIRDAAAYVPNVTLGDFSVRRLTFPYMRGIGSGRNSPAVTTVIDGVPQLSYATANQEFLSVERVEFLRGAQGSLYGQNALGGTLNIIPRLPTREPSGSVTFDVGAYDAYGLRAEINGPLGKGSAAGSAAGGYAARDGYSRTRRSEDGIDSRGALFGFAQLYLPDQGPWNFRLSLSAESDRDGDYTLKDLFLVRLNPDQTPHDFVGYSDRDLLQPVLTVEREGEWADFTSVTALQAWRSHDLTDLDMLPLSLMRRDNREFQLAWIEEARLVSPPDAPVRIGDHLACRWLAGLFAFTSTYEQNAYNDYRPLGALLFGMPMPHRQHDDANLAAWGVSLFGQTTFTLDERLEVGLGLRADLEQRSFDAASYTRPLIVQPPAFAEGDKIFRHLSPRATVSYRLNADLLAYIEASRGFKAGGFNAQSSAGKASYDEESSWTFEAGVKSAWLDNRLAAQASVFRTLWKDIQLDVPSGLPNLYYIDNAGRAVSRGAELEIQARPVAACLLFGGAGLLDTRFSRESASGGVDIGGNDLPFAPHATWHGGCEVRRELKPGASGFLRVEGVGNAGYAYDAPGGAAQGGYMLVHLRTGVDARDWRIEFWVRNLLDRAYAPLAFPYPLSLTGYVGEPGPPRTLGVSFTRRF